MDLTCDFILDLSDQSFIGTFGASLLDKSMYLASQANRISLRGAEFESWEQVRSLISAADTEIIWDLNLSALWVRIN